MSEVKINKDSSYKELTPGGTIYDAGNTNRASNIALAAKTINVILFFNLLIIFYLQFVSNSSHRRYFYFWI